MHLAPRCSASPRWLAAAALAASMIISACSVSPASSGATRASAAAVTEPVPTLAVTALPAATESPTKPPSPAPTPAATSTPAGSQGAPATPDGVDLQVEHGVEGTDGRLATRYTVSWTGPLDPDTSIRVIGVTTCPVPPPASGERVCVTNDTPLPARIRTLIAKGPASSGSVSWLWPEQDVDGPVLAFIDGVSYVAYVVRAVNPAGASPFVVVRSAVTCPNGCMG